SSAGLSGRPPISADDRHGDAISEFPEGTKVMSLLWWNTPLTWISTEYSPGVRGLPFAERLMSMAPPPIMKPSLNSIDESGDAWPVVAISPSANAMAATNDQDDPVSV